MNMGVAGGTYVDDSALGNPVTMERFLRAELWIREFYKNGDLPNEGFAS